MRYSEFRIRELREFRSYRTRQTLSLRREGESPLACEDLTSQSTITASLWHLPQETDHHPLDDEFRSRQQVGIMRVLCPKKWFALLHQVTFQRRFTVNERRNDLPILRNPLLQ